MRIQIDVHVHLANVDQLECIEKALHNLLTLGEETMTIISDSAAAQKAAFARMDSAFAGITSDFTVLVAKIEELQNSPGGITPEDQTLLNEVQVMAEDLASKFEALDAARPPVEPPVVA